MVDKSTVTKVCIDDFAMKKRHIYGTVMVNIETKKIIDLLDSRDLNDVTEWLRSYPNLEIISRDGSQTYAAAIRHAHPEAIQVSDRFHLLKNLTDYCKSYITKVMGFKIKIKQLSDRSNERTVNTNISNRKSSRIREAQHLNSLGFSEKKIGLKLKMDIRTVKKYIALGEDNLSIDAPQEKHKETVSKKEKNINLVRKLKDEGCGIRQISKITGLSRQTIRRYLNPNISAVHGSYGVARECALSDFHSVVEELVSSGQTFKKIEEHIRHNGYTGSASAIRMYTTRKRRLIEETIQSEADKYELVDRKHLIKLLYKPIEKIKEISEELLRRIISEYPILADIYKLLSTFKETLFGKRAKRLDPWINSAKLLNISEINSFIKGIENDIEGVRNSIIYEYNNGLAEGNVNKIKVIKRIMYGRCKFETLRRKVLSLEQFRKIN
ncbi:ISL3 family transposase [Clostridium sp. UBA4548]|uniref:ISL3 family transposase n=1 Tax=Clostridium sp. UBA4548 TaxID=1946361 RepID=UPI0025BDC706|nr:ISL3 family transposase [Clostridium sp. UBA4548]